MIKTKPNGLLDERVKAVNEHGGFGNCQWPVSKQPGDVADILKRCAGCDFVSFSEDHERHFIF